MFDFGLRIQQLRISHNLTQEELGKKIGRSKSVVCGYENNTAIPPLEVLTQLAVIFNVSLDYLVGIDKNEMVSLSGLNQKQRELINILISELKSPTVNYQGLTEKEQDILNRIMIEFHKKHK
ncbi:MAG: helix-turn-helix transcriptional regulator [Ruminococcaceae bacterium]|nr:helix-turn-helix transcriptional regulator [Oscillospiraceae bacterium]